MWYVLSLMRRTVFRHGVKTFAWTICIGDFIRNLQNRKNLNHTIPISCFTATAKQKVISDIVLDFFKGKGQTIEKLRSGDPLNLDGDYLVTGEPRSRRIAKLSIACRGKLAELREKGYTVKCAEVRFAVWWKGKEDDEETLIVLPNLYLIQMKKSHTGGVAAVWEDCSGRPAQLSLES